MPRRKLAARPGRSVPPSASLSPGLSVEIASGRGEVKADEEIESWDKEEIADWSVYPTLDEIELEKTGNESRQLPSHITLSADDGGRFSCFSEILAEYPTFFDKVAELAATQRQGESEEVIVNLPDVTSAGLGLTLALLFPTEQYHNVLEEEKDVTRLCIAIHDALKLAEVYQLFTIPECISQRYKNDPWMDFAIAAVLDNQALAISMSEPLVTQANSQCHSMAKRLLDQYGKSYIKRLQRAQGSRWALWVQFHEDMRNGEVMINGKEEYGRRCLHNGGCAAFYNSGGHFENLRKEAADTVWEQIKGLQGSGTDTVMAVIRFVADEKTSWRGKSCRWCNYRIRATFEQAYTRYRRAMKRAPKTISRI